MGEDCDLGAGINGSFEVCCTSSCKFKPDNAPCDDGVFCDGSERCLGGECGTSSGNPCAATSCAICDEGNVFCDTSQCPELCGNGHVDVGEQCDLGRELNGAATNCCDTSCDYKPNGSSCTDQLFCNGEEQCTGGVCGQSPGNPCGDCAPCDEANNACDTRNCPAAPLQPSRELLIKEIFDGDGDGFGTSAAGSVRGTLDLDANGDLRFTAADLPRLPRCAGDAVLIGGICIDKYEASVFANPPGSAVLGRQFGVSADDYPCADNGSNCRGQIFARSLAGVTPTGHATWFQAQQACGNVGKRLLSNAEWQMAVVGTPDSGGTQGCNTDSQALVVATGSRSSCVSKWGTYDMVGNVWEWVADWMPVSTGCPGWGSFSDDMMCLSGASTDATFPGGIIRGGARGLGPQAGPLAINASVAPFSSDVTIGFRCARAPS